MATPEAPRAPSRRSLRRPDAAVSDLVGTLLVVALVVAVGVSLTVLVSANLVAPQPPASSFSVGALPSGSGTASIVFRNGESVPLDDLRVTMTRNESAPITIPRASWQTPDASYLHSGDRLTVALAPAAGAGERIRFTLTRVAANVVVSDVETRAGGTISAAAYNATLNASFSPNSTIADGTTSTLLRARLSYPMGTLGVARVEVDLTRAINTSTAAVYKQRLGDAGIDGDEVGGDGTWSTLVRLPSTTPAGWYNLTINATDLAGNLVASTVAPLQVTGNGFGGGGGTGNGTGNGTGGGGGTVVGGTCYGCVVSGGTRAYAGTRLQVPTSSNVTQLRLVNWTVDDLHPERLDDDFVLFRIVGAAQGWSAMIELEEFNGQPYAIKMHVWSDTYETIYVPANSTGNAPRLSLRNMSMDLLAPVASQQWIRLSGAANPVALYQNANITGEPTLIITYMGQDVTTSNKQASLETGIYSFDMVVG